MIITFVQSAHKMRGNFMQLLVITILLSVLGFATSFILVGIFPSIIAFCLSIYCFLQKKSINIVRALGMSFGGMLVPIIMYLNCYGISLPFDKGTGMPFARQIIYDNYTNMGFDMSFLENKELNSEADSVDTESNSSREDKDIHYVSEGASDDSAGLLKSDSKIAGAKEENDEKEVNENKNDSIDYRDYPDTIFEKFEEIENNYDIKPASGFVGASDDDMPSYGGLPLGTVVVAQYFREDDHNCNPVIVLKNETGNLHRYECIFTARDEEGNEIAISEKTSEVVPDGAQFVIEGRFDKSELGGKKPSMYEFTITKRVPYEEDMTDEVMVYTKVDGNSVVLAADNKSDRKVKVDAYVLFFDGDELVDCIWLIPSNTDEVCIDPMSLATIKGDAYYRFDRIETYYTAYEAIETQ